MDTKKISIGDIVNESWAIIKKNIWIFLATTLGFGLIVSLIYYLFIGAGMAAAMATGGGDPSAMLTGIFSFGFFAGMLVLAFISAAFYIGYYKMALDAADGLNPDLSAFSGITVKKILNLFIANILYGIIVEIGFILCLIPGIFFAIRLQLYVFYIIERDCNALEALSKSWEATKGESLNIFLLGLVFALINFVGALLCGIGMLVTIPMTLIAFALIYRILTGGKPGDDVEFEAIVDEKEPLV